MNEPLLQFLGLAMKARCVSVGFLKSTESAKKRQAQLLLISNDISAKTAKEVRFVGEKYSVQVRDINYSSAQLSQAIGIKSGVISINDEGFAKKVFSLIDNKI